MQDALRPDDETFRHFYETGYRQWRRLHLAAVVASPLDVTRLGIQDAFPRHPSFPPRLELNRNSSSVLHATGTSTWETATGDCDLSPLRMSFVFAVTAAYPITISLESNHSAPDLFTSRGNHIPVLTLAWAYVLAARWTEIIPGASVEYTGRLATPRDRGNVSPLVIDVGNVGQEAARWRQSWLLLTDGTPAYGIAAALSSPRGPSTSSLVQPWLCLHVIPPSSLARHMALPRPSPPPWAISSTTQAIIKPTTRATRPLRLPCSCQLAAASLSGFAGPFHDSTTTHHLTLPPNRLTRPREPTPIS
ncbi:hypothetical protein G6O67_003403 [Ophiocordyceps sinensis]|uniref:Uncharacterized protein n=1 Tax=Ophiocordyceps sinensis TaxID=72228 RepID=A0A8H4V893_9HYPO|nr:hypothetical protein G6O67_003403 [Ophiocordyceps sinensis]